MASTKISVICQRLGFPSVPEDELSIESVIRTITLELKDLRRTDLSVDEHTRQVALVEALEEIRVVKGLSMRGDWA